MIYKVGERVSCEEYKKWMCNVCHWVPILLCLVHVIWTECRMLKLVLDVKYLLFFIFFNCSRVLQLEAHSRYYKGALTQIVLLSDLLFMSAGKIKTKYSTLNSSFNALSKWHEPDIRGNNFSVCTWRKRVDDTNKTLYVLYI